MCVNCKEWDEKLYPDLGEGAFLQLNMDTIETGINKDDALGIRISQERDVSYVGPEGAVEKHEVQSVIIPWHVLRALTVNLIDYSMQHEREHPDEYND